MQEKEAVKLVEDFLDAHGLRGADLDLDPAAEERSAEGKGEDLFAGGDPEIAFRFFSEKGELKCYALIYEFVNPPRPGVLEGCQEEAKKPGTDMGGGQLEFDPSDRGLYLTRSYTQPVSVQQFTQDLEKLQAASITWGEEVLDRVATKVFAS